MNLKLKEKWKNLNKGYIDISREVYNKGFSAIGNLIFFPFFVFGFILFKNIGNDSIDIKTPFEVVFNWTLLGYSTLVSIASTLLYLLIGQAFFKGFLARSIEMTMSLLFICLTGYSMKVVKCPFLGEPNKYSFIIFSEILVFCYLWLLIRFFVDNKIENKSKTLKTLQWVVIVLFIMLLLIPIFIS